MTLELWMVIVGITMTAGSIPQAHRIWKYKSSEDISIILWVVMVHGLFWWLYYGIQVDSISLIITNIIGIVLDSSVLILAVKYRYYKEVE